MVVSAVEAGLSVREIYLRVLQPVQHEVGRLWQAGRISIGHEHYCTNATQLVMARLYPHVFSGDRGGRRAVVACVRGELHELGARMVSDFFEMAGWDSVFLGANTPRQRVIATLVERPTHLLAIGVTMLDQVEEARQLIADVRGSAASRVKILVGGHAFRGDSVAWQEIGADGTAADADQAIATGAALLGVDRER
jgi:methanogenic corrinoid protein MtbC1